MEEYSYQLKIPKERIAVLIGTKGSVKANIEEITGTEIAVNSKEGDVQIVGKDSVKLFIVREVITAIARGFNPDIALLLLKQDYALEIINMLDYAHNKNDLPRVKGRIIGSEGKSRKTIERLTECYIVVFGKTIGVIGSLEYIGNAKRAIEMLLEGSPHANVFRWLEKKRREMKRFDYSDRNEIELKEDV